MIRELKTRKQIYPEPFLEERIEAARDYAERLFYKKINNVKDLEMFYRSILSNHYGIPIFDKYFEERTFDELIFEAHLIKLYNTPHEELAKNFVLDNLEEAAAVVEEEWEEVDALNERLEDLQKMTEFMKTGKFEGE